MHRIELIGRWPLDMPSGLQVRVEEIIAWKISHNPAWYPQPGRTLVLVGDDPNYKLKVKGAGFYNPSNISFSGARRTTVPVPEGMVPMPPLQQAFKRDLIHADPSNTPPHLMESVHSTFAPIGGMTLDAAMNDQLMFSQLTATGLPSNRPLVSYKYHELFLDEKPMGVSVSQLPANALSITPYHLYLAWHQPVVSRESLEFLRAYSGKDQFSLENPVHRLEVLAKLAFVAGKLLLQFSTRAGLYRFSGSPDNWNVRFDLNAPLFFSDVDTSRTLPTIASTQWGWEVLRNLISAIHQWVYFFMPCLTYEESGYSAQLLRDGSRDFVRAMLSGFFAESGEDAIEKITRKIWRFLDVPLAKVSREIRIGLRSGEYALQRHYPRPVFYFVMLNLLSELIQGSELQRVFTGSDTSLNEIRSYVDMSSQHPSHAQMFPGYSPSKTSALIAEILAIS